MSEQTKDATPEDIANVCKLLERLRTGEMNLIPSIASASERKQDKGTEMLQRVESVLCGVLRSMDAPAQPAAFPSDYTVEGHRYINEGITFRDYFAAKALVGLLAEPFTPGSKSAVQLVTGRSSSSAEAAEHFAQAAYTLADAMLRARSVLNKENGNG